MELEKIKSKVRRYKNKNTIILLFLVMFIILTMLFIAFQNTALSTISILGFFIVLVILITHNVTNRLGLEDEIFKKCILPVLEDSFDGFKYDDSVNVDKFLIESIGIIYTADRMSTSYGFEGRYRKVPFVSNALLCEERREDSDGDAYYADTFRGRVIVLGISILNDDSYVDIIDANYGYCYDNVSTRKATLSHKIEEHFNIFVTSDSSSLPLSFLDYLAKIKKKNPYYIFNLRICKDRIYMFIDNINMKPYDIVGDLLKVTQNDIDFIIKKDSSFITNTISCILDGKGDK